MQQHWIYQFINSWKLLLLDCQRNPTYGVNIILLVVLKYFVVDLAIHIGILRMLMFLSILLLI